MPRVFDSDMVCTTRTQVTQSGGVSPRAKNKLTTDFTDRTDKGEINFSIRVISAISGS
jgi:hypothetical protein